MEGHPCVKKAPEEGSLTSQQPLGMIVLGVRTRVPHFWPVQNLTMVRLGASLVWLGLPLSCTTAQDPSSRSSQQCQHCATGSPFISAPSPLFLLETILQGLSLSGFGHLLARQPHQLTLDHGPSKE